MLPPVCPEGVGFLMTDGSLFSHAGGNFINRISAERTRHSARIKVSRANTHRGLSVKLRISLGPVRRNDIQILPFTIIHESRGSGGVSGHRSMEGHRGN